MYLVEQFVYPTGVVLDGRGWYSHNDSENPILVSNEGLSWSKTHHKGSGIGNSAALNNVGIDINKPFNERVTFVAYMLHFYLINF